ncbi:TrkH family potassium uptake protein [Thermosinus carboxydivorans]|uniref:TrkH family potassium uptake protein n=1 Tax=Thermosinus carboxydivorans TaxID=261685 RepID=UPI000680F33F|nr:TrkH family potassium uptake protein [Thermosinus carboxydivorans]
MFDGGIILSIDPRTDDLLDIAKWRLTPYQVLVLGFAGLIFVGALLLTSPLASTSGKPTPFVDALFTATSAVCVTGLVVVDTGSHWSLFGQLVIITLIQIGGLGIMSMATLIALLIGKKIQLRERLIMQEALNQLTMAGVVRLMIYVMKTTFIIELIGGTILAIRWFADYGPRGIYYGYWHAVSAFCNAGFDLFGDFRSLTGYVDDLTVNIVITLLIILGGIGFTVIADVWDNRRFSKFSLHTKLVLTVSAFLIIFGAAVISLLEWNNPDTLGGLSWQGKLLASYFQSVTPRTAGYNTLDIGKLESGTLFFLIILMFIGASPASTGGGVKTSTFGVLVLAIAAQISGKNDVEIFQRRIPVATVYKAFTVVFLSALLVILVTLALTVTEQAPFLNILFEVVSAFGTVGLSTGITPTLTVAGKLWLILTMFAGRVGPVTLALAIALRARKGALQLPEGRVIIG